MTTNKLVRYSLWIELCWYAFYLHTLLQIVLLLKLMSHLWSVGHCKIDQMENLVDKLKNTEVLKIFHYFLSSLVDLCFQIKTHTYLQSKGNFELETEIT